MRKLWLALGLLSQVACTVKVESPNINGHINVDGSAVLKCTANLPDDLNGIIASGVSFPIKITASGGAGQYKINATGESFGTEITIVKTFENSGANNEVKTDTIQVKDGANLIAECSYTVTVTPEVDPSDLACSIAPGVASPHINQVTPFVVTATGGAGGYTFSQFSLGDSGTVQGTPLSTATQYFANGKYTTAGSKTVSIKVGDGTDEVTCTKSLTVRPALVVNAVPTPSASVSADGTITLTASSDGFAAAPTYTFTGTSGAVISASGNVATITSQNQQVRQVIIVVEAKQGGETASLSVHLNFTAIPPLLCELKHPAGTYKVDDSVVYTVTASTNEAVEILSFYAGAAGSVTAQTSSTRTVKYSAAGNKVPYAIAKVRRGNTDVYCNYGDYIYDSISIANKTLELACNVTTSPSWSYTYEYINIEVTLPSGKGGSGGVYVSSLLTNGNYIPWDGYGYYFYDAGTKPIQVKVKDSAGTEATCNTNHIVYDYWWY